MVDVNQWLAEEVLLYYDKGRWLLAVKGSQWFDFLTAMNLIIQSANRQTTANGLSHRPEKVLNAKSSHIG